MFKTSSRAAITIIIAIGLFCAAIVVGKGIVIGFADRSDLKGDSQAIAKQIPTPVSTSEAHLNNPEASAIATRYFEPFWLLVLGATLLAIGTSIKRIARADAKTGGKSERAL
ncbi:MAG: hypothetical protein WBV94_16060 [Blastocatellia bacterium]